MIQTLEQYQDIFKCLYLDIASGSGDEEYYDLSPNNYYELELRGAIAPKF